MLWNYLHIPEAVGIVPPLRGSFCKQIAKGIAEDDDVACAPLQAPVSFRRHAMVQLQSTRYRDDIQERQAGLTINAE